MRILKKIHTYIPGFRQLKSSSMVLAVTYYGAAIFIFAKYWHWGLAMLALPFLVFNLLERNAESGSRAVTFLAAASGILMLLGTAGGLAQGSAGPIEAPHPAVITPEPSVSHAAAPSAAAIPAASAAAQPTAAPADASGYAYVASKSGEVFHLPDCPDAKRIMPANLIGFKTRQEAVDSGRRACKKCGP